jgi:hypothetical protein
MSLNEKEGVAGLSITRPQPTLQTTNYPNVMPTIEDVESTHSGTPTLTPTRSRTADERETSPFSPFYSHPTTRYSLEANKSESKQNINLYESDVEACLTDSNTNVLSTAHTKTNKECTVWPGKQALLEKKKAARRRKGCNPMRNLDKRTKIWVKILIGLFVIGTAVGVGVGISKAVGGGVWNSGMGAKPIS